AERFPWTWWESPFWEQLVNPAHTMPSAFRVDGPLLSPTLGDVTRRDPVAPVRADAKIECAALSGDRLATGTSAGTLTLHRLLPVLGHGFAENRAMESDEEASDGEGDGWLTIKTRGNTALQLRGRNWRLLPANGAPVQLQPHPGWDHAAAVAVSADGKLVVLGGFSSRSGGFSSSGIILSDPSNGTRIGDLEPVEALRNLSFLGDSHRLAVAGSTGVLITDVRPDGFDRVSFIPVT